MSEVKRWEPRNTSLGYDMQPIPSGSFVLSCDYDALAAQRDEGLAREAELRSALQGMLEYFPEGYSDGEHFSIETAKAALAFRGCSDQEQQS